MSTDGKNSNCTVAEIEKMLATIDRDRRAVSDSHCSSPPFEPKLAKRFKARHSEFMEYENCADAQALQILVKHITQGRTPNAAEECVIREYNALVALRRKGLLELGAGVPAPLAMFPKAGVLIMEKLPGTPLDVILKRKANFLIGVCWRVKASEVGCRVARWLKQFHLATSRPVGSHKSSSYLASLAASLDRCVQKGLSHKAANEVRKMAEDASQIFEGETARTAARHGDFIPQNILVDGGSVALVDFENFSERDLIYEDMGTFLAYLRLQAGSPLYSRLALKAVTDGFLSGYGEDVSAGLLSLYTVKSAVKNAAEFQPNGGIRTQVRAPFMWSQLVRLSRDLLGGISRSHGGI